jgi:nucleoid-associated protein YgaU
MRKEVKLGMAIGGGLIAVLVVYLLFTPPTNNNKNGTQLAGANGANGSIIEIQQPGEPLSGAAAGVDDKGTAPAAVKPTGDAGAGQAAVGNGNPPEVQTTTTHDAGNERPAAPAGRKGARDAWDKALVEGKTDKGAPTPPAAPVKPVAVTGKTGTARNDREASKTGTARNDREAAKPAPSKHDAGLALATPASGGSEPKLYFNPNEAWGGGVSTGAVFGTETHTAAKSTAGGHATSGSVTSAAAARHSPAEGTHVVQAGDTLSSIAAEAYGSAAYYPHILRANPTVNPNNLKLGTTLILPKADEVKATAAPTAVGNERSTGVVASIVQDTRIDPKTQYQVQSGDSLYKISMKLYGKSGYVERIYEKNKALIGSDPKKLKLGTILELPEKTTVAAAGSAASQQEASDETDRR